MKRGVYGTGNRVIEQRGSFTIEAAVIVPLILWCIVMLVYGALYEYDIACLWQGTYLAALKAEVQAGDSIGKKERAEELLRRYLSEELWSAEAVELETGADSFRVFAVAEAGMRVPAAGGFFKNSWRMEARSTVARLRPAAFIRICNRAESIADRLSEGGKDL